MSELAITTSQNVQIIFKSASVGERMIAALIDLLVKIAYVLTVSFFVFYVFNMEKKSNHGIHGQLQHFL